MENRAETSLSDDEERRVRQVSSFVPPFESILDDVLMKPLVDSCAELAAAANEALAGVQVSVADLQAIVTIRRMEEELHRLRREGFIVPNIHQGIGQEALALGSVGCLRPGDLLTATYRGRAQAYVKGAPLAQVMAECLHRSTGLSAGRAGPMHMIDRRCNLLFESAIVGGAAPIAVGAAFALRYAGRDDIAMTVFGDGTTAQGTWHESVNLAGAWGLPVVFVLENNGYSEMTPAGDTTALAAFSWRSLGHGIPAVSVDGNDLRAVRAVTQAAITWARSGKGPVMVEAETYRLSGHYAGEPGLYRPPGELEAWEQRDPIRRLTATLLDNGHSQDDIDQVHAAAEGVVAAATAEALAGAPVDASTVGDHVYAAGVGR